MNNERRCKTCNSENIKAIHQYSNEEGKIITEWICLECNEQFETKW